MKLPKTKVAAVGTAALGVMGIVAAILEWWSVAVAVIIAFQAAAVAILVLKRVPADIPKTLRAVSRIERRLQATEARGTAVDEEIRADIADALAEMTELTKSPGLGTSGHASP